MQAVLDKYPADDPIQSAFEEDQSDAELLMQRVADTFPHSKVPSTSEAWKIINMANSEVIDALFLAYSQQANVNDLHSIGKIFISRLQEANGDYSAILLEGKRALERKKTVPELKAKEMMKDTEPLNSRLPNRQATPLSLLEQAVEEGKKVGTVT